MPPKKAKGKKGKKAKAADGGGADPVNEKDEEDRKLMHSKAKSLHRETHKEERDFNEFQQQREKLNYFWIVEKKNLEDKKAELRNKERELQDLEEKHQVEIKIYKQRVKHLLAEFQDQITDSKTGSEVALKLAQDDHRVAESDLKSDRRGLRLEVKEMELAHDDFLKSLKQEQDRNITLLRHEFERKASETQKNYEKRMKVVRDRLDERRKRETSRIEQSKNAHIEQLMKSHEKTFADIKNYYNDITHNNLDLIKSLKEEVAEMRKKEQADEKQMEHIAQENKRMSEPFKKAKADVEQLAAELQRYEAEKEELRETKGSLLVVEREYSSLKWENEVQLQRYAEARKQRDELYERFQSAVYDVQQKTGFRNLLLQKQITSVDETLEQRRATLDEVLARANLEPSVVGQVRRRVEDALQRKQAKVSDLETELSRVNLEHKALLAAMHAKMAELNLPLQALGFVPQRQMAGS